MFDLSCADLKIELGLSHVAVAQLQKEEKAEERTKKVTKDLEREDIFFKIYSRSMRNMFNMLLLCLQSIDIMHRRNSMSSGRGCSPRKTSARQ